MNGNLAIKYSHRPASFKPTFTSSSSFSRSKTISCYSLQYACKPLWLLRNPENSLRCPVDLCMPMAVQVQLFGWKLPLGERASVVWEWLDEAQCGWYQHLTEYCWSSKFMKFHQFSLQTWVLKRVLKYAFTFRNLLKFSYALVLPSLTIWLTLTPKQIIQRRIKRTGRCL